MSTASVVSSATSCSVVRWSQARKKYRSCQVLAYRLAWNFWRSIKTPLQKYRTASRCAEITTSKYTCHFVGGFNARYASFCGVKANNRQSLGHFHSVSEYGVQGCKQGSLFQLDPLPSIELLLKLHSTALLSLSHDRTPHDSVSSPQTKTHKTPTFGSFWSNLAFFMSTNFMAFHLRRLPRKNDNTRRLFRISKKRMLAKRFAVFIDTTHFLCKLILR